MLDNKIFEKINCKNYEFRKIDEEYKLATKKFLEFTYFQYIHKSNSDYLLKSSFFEFLNLPQIITQGIFHALIEDNRDYITYNEFVEGISMLFDKYLPQDNTKLIKLLFNIFKFSKIEHQENSNNDINNNYNINENLNEKSICSSIEKEKTDINNKKINNQMIEKSIKLNENIISFVNKKHPNQDKNLINKTWQKEKTENKNDEKNSKINKIKEDNINNFNESYNSYNTRVLFSSLKNENSISKKNEIILVKFLNVFLNNMILKLFLLSKNYQYDNFMSVCEEIKLIIRKAFGTKDEISYNEFQNIINTDQELYFIIIFLFYCVTPINENITNLIISNKTSQFFRDETNLSEDDFEEIKINNIPLCNSKKSLVELENNTENINILNPNMFNNNINNDKNNLTKNKENMIDFILSETESFSVDFKQDYQEVKNTNSLENLYYNINKGFSPQQGKKLDDLDLNNLNIKIEANKLERKFILDSKANKVIAMTNSLITYHNSNPACSSNNLLNLNQINNNAFNLNKNHDTNNIILIPNITTNNNNNYSNLINFMNSPYKDVSNNNMTAGSNNFLNSKNQLNSFYLNKNLFKTNLTNNYNKLTIHNFSSNTIINNLNNIRNDWIVKVVKNLTDSINEKKKLRYRSSYFTIFYEKEIVYNNNENRISHDDLYKLSQKDSLKNKKSSDNLFKINYEELKQNSQIEDFKLPVFNFTKEGDKNCDKIESDLFDVEFSNKICIFAKFINNFSRSRI